MDLLIRWTSLFRFAPSWSFSVSPVALPPPPAHFLQPGGGRRAGPATQASAREDVPPQGADQADTESQTQGAPR
jgi:hypothetical protein